MKIYTVIGYDLPSGGHRFETITANNPTEAAQEAGRKNELAKHEWEIVGVIKGEARFCEIDHTAVTLAPYVV